jgi:hypothetical protein
MVVDALKAAVSHAEGIRAMITPALLEKLRTRAALEHRTLALRPLLPTCYHGDFWVAKRSSNARQIDVSENEFIVL